MLPSIIMPAERRLMMFYVAVAVLVVSNCPVQYYEAVCLGGCVWSQKNILKIENKIARPVCDTLMGLN